MHILKRMGGRLAGAVIVIVVISIGVWIFDSFDGNSDTGSMKVGSCFLMTDGPARGSGETDEITPQDLTAEDEYPTVDCAKWADEAEPWKVYRVEWVKNAGGDNGTAYDLEQSCPDLTITVGGNSVTCLANLELENENA